MANPRRYGLLATFALLAALLTAHVIIPPHDLALRGWPGGAGDTSATAAADRAMLLAIQAQDLAGVRRAIARGADVNRLDDQNWSPLTHAAAVGDLEICAALLARGASPDGDGAGGNPEFAHFPPLVCATTQGNVALIDLLVRHGADVEARAPNGATPLNVAAILNQRAAALALIRAGADVDAADADGWTPLMAVAVSGDADELMEVLLAAGARVEARNGAGDTAAAIAARQGDHRAVSLLHAYRRRPPADAPGDHHTRRRRNHLLGLAGACEAKVL